MTRQSKYFKKGYPPERRGNGGGKIHEKKENNKQGVVIRRTGSYRLSRVLRQSTIGDKRFNGRVRNGIGWDTLAITTGSSNYYGEADFCDEAKYLYCKKQANQTISIG